MPRQWHWWIVATDTDSRPYVIYGAPDFGSAGGEAVARAKAFELVGSLDWDLKRLATRDLSAARAYICGNRLESGLGLRESTKRQVHERGILRHRQLAERRAQR